MLKRFTTYAHKDPHPEVPFVDGKRGMLTHHQYRKQRVMAAWKFLLRMVICLVIVLTVAVVWLAIRHMAADDELSEQRSKTKEAYSQLAQAMNGRALLDRDTSTAFFFDKPVVVALVPIGKEMRK